MVFLADAYVGPKYDFVNVLNVTSRVNALFLWPSSLSVVHNGDIFISISPAEL